MTVNVLGSAAETTAAPWVPTDESFAARLALVRWKKGWNVKEAAIACGLPAASWRSWESGTLPRQYVAIVTIIAAKAGCDRGWLMDGRAQVTLPQPIGLGVKPVTRHPTGHPQGSKRPGEPRRPSRLTPIAA